MKQKLGRINIRTPPRITMLLEAVSMVICVEDGQQQKYQAKKKKIE